MNTKKLLKFQIIATIFVIILGSLLHFTYEWSNRNGIVALFSSVNESTWEHLKLAFFPMSIILITGYIFFGKKYIVAQTIGILVTISFITVFFYTYTGIIGKNISVIDISTFIIGVIIGEIVTYLIMKNEKILNSNLSVRISIFIIILLFFCFTIFTYIPPRINLFRNPLTFDYCVGIKNIDY